MVFLVHSIDFVISIAAVRMLDGEISDAVEGSSLSLRPEYLDIYSSRLTVSLRLKSYMCSKFKMLTVGVRTMMVKPLRSRGHSASILC